MEQDMNYGLANWFVLFVAILIALLGLLLAAKGVDAGMSLAGWLFFIFGVGFAFRMAGRMATAPDER
jgi:hypothetical protein